MYMYVLVYTYCVHAYVCIHIFTHIQFIFSCTLRFVLKWKVPYKYNSLLSLLHICFLIRLWSRRMCLSAMAREASAAWARRWREPAECCWLAPTTVKSACATLRAACSCARWRVTPKPCSAWRWGGRTSDHHLWQNGGTRVLAQFLLTARAQVVNDLVFSSSSDALVHAYNIHVSENRRVITMNLKHSGLLKFLYKVFL